MFFQGHIFGDNWFTFENFSDFGRGRCGIKNCRKLLDFPVNMGELWTKNSCNPTILILRHFLRNQLLGTITLQVMTIDSLNNFDYERGVCALHTLLKFYSSNWKNTRDMGKIIKLYENCLCCNIYAIHFLGAITFV